MGPEYSWAFKPELARNWSAASQRRFSKLAAAVSFSEGAIQRMCVLSGLAGHCGQRPGACGRSVIAGVYGPGMGCASNMGSASAVWMFPCAQAAVNVRMTGADNFFATGFRPGLAQPIAGRQEKELPNPPGAWC